jgi:hypothetical protein
MENNNVKKKPFEAPALTEYGTLSELTQNHKNKHSGHGRAWGHYKDRDDEFYSFPTVS